MILNIIISIHDQYGEQTNSTASAPELNNQLCERTTEHRTENAHAKFLKFPELFLKESVLYLTRQEGSSWRCPHSTKNVSVCIITKMFAICLWRTTEFFNFRRKKFWKKMFNPVVRFFSFSWFCPSHADLLPVSAEKLVSRIIHMWDATTVRSPEAACSDAAVTHIFLSLGTR